MDNLLEGRVPGPLTGVRLAELAGVKRHRLTHDNADLNKIFQKRAREINRCNPEVERLRSQLTDERQRNKRIVQERDKLKRGIESYATALLNVTEERDRLRNLVEDLSAVTPIGRG